MFDCAAVDAEALPRTRVEAVAVGAKRYFTGQPCANKHLAPRYASTGQCVDCVRASSRRFETTNREYRRARLRARYEANREEWRAYHRAWKAEHRQETRDAANRARVQLVAMDAILAWARAAVSSARQRAKKRQVPFDLCPEYVRSLAVPLCPALGAPLIYSAQTGGGPLRNSASLDCLVPALGYVPGNVQVLSHKANSIKSDATPEELAAVAAWAERAQPK